MTYQIKSIRLAAIMTAAGAVAAFADPLNCSLTGYKAMPGLTGPNGGLTEA
jgi:hypothetical protein